MKFGAVFPQLEIDASDIDTYITEVEKMNFDFLLAFDHIVGVHRDIVGYERPYGIENQFHEVLTLLSYVAAITKQLELFTGVLILPQRPAVLVAKQAAQVDVLSKGRLRLGVGVGWNQYEMAALGKTFEDRGKRSEEQIEVLRKLWTEVETSFKGDYHQFERIGLNPMPVQQPIPIWFGGSADVVLKRMAKLGDGWIISGWPLDITRSLLPKLKGYLDDNNRRFDDFRVMTLMKIIEPLPADWEAHCNANRELGVKYIGVNTMGGGFQSVDEHLEALRQFKNTVS